MKKRRRIEEDDNKKEEEEEEKEENTEEEDEEEKREQEQVDEGVYRSFKTWSQPPKHAISSTTTKYSHKNLLLI